MPGFFIDFLILALLVVGGMAFMGEIVNGIGHLLFGGKKGRFTNKTADTSAGWKKVGGRS
ncbi:hypothetical protein ACJ2A9_16510 [Anaerobacillus sp. MEB173]|uniref:hypothetical protein n=1 Tax=Anaerobacillus sp. MEB173 TaxID=3383345 RepID=UPI003F8FD12E